MVGIPLIFYGIYVCGTNFTERPSNNSSRLVKTFESLISRLVSAWRPADSSRGVPARDVSLCPQVQPRHLAVVDEGFGPVLPSKRGVEKLGLDGKEVSRHPAGGRQDVLRLG